MRNVFGYFHLITTIGTSTDILFGGGYYPEIPVLTSRATLHSGCGLGETQRLLYFVTPILPCGLFAVHSPFWDLFGAGWVRRNVYCTSLLQSYPVACLPFTPLSGTSWVRVGSDEVSTKGTKHILRTVILSTVTVFTASSELAESAGKHCSILLLVRTCKLALSSARAASELAESAGKHCSILLLVRTCKLALSSARAVSELAESANKHYSKLLLVRTCKLAPSSARAASKLTATRQLAKTAFGADTGAYS
ncbi:hypothetical protein RRG08_031300 [Elysia crispata]|uniref:Uncharacterized protein n=1 Tax=Elysia crispata TaxID=231223 RepID=A0AAE1AIP5_9GAST|nr:hypothetical protein RRG08_031300 [Elysia crispata]